MSEARGKRRRVTSSLPSEQGKEEEAGPREFWPPPDDFRNKAMGESSKLIKADSIRGFYKVYLTVSR
jgi:hypothetical protein